MKTKIKVIEGDITSLAIDAIVNAANTTLLGGGGVDGAIHRSAGAKLLEECRTLGGCKTGEAKLTKGYNLKARYVIHTVGPIWYGGDKNEENLLSGCYTNSLQIALENGVKTIAFPSISTGVYSFPFEKAAKIAFKSVKEFLSKDDSFEEVIFVCFSKKDYDIYMKLIYSS